MIFAALGNNVATIPDQMGTIENVVITNDTAEIYVVNSEGGTAAGYLIYLVLGDDGQWRIVHM